MNENYAYLELHLNDVLVEAVIFLKYDAVRIQLTRVKTTRRQRATKAGRPGN